MYWTIGGDRGVDNYSNGFQSTNKKLSDKLIKKSGQTQCEDWKEKTELI